MPLRFITPNIAVEGIKYKKVSESLMVPTPPIRMRTADGKLVEKVRVVADKRYLWNGKELASEIRLIDPETERQVPSHEVLEVLNHYKYKLLTEDGREVSDKEIRYFAVQEDGSEQEVGPYERTTVIEIPEEHWVPSTSVNGFLVERILQRCSISIKRLRIVSSRRESSKATLRGSRAQAERGQSRYNNLLLGQGVQGVLLYC